MSEKFFYSISMSHKNPTQPLFYQIPLELEAGYLAASHLANLNPTATEEDCPVCIFLRKHNIQPEKIDLGEHHRGRRANSKQRRLKRRLQKKARKRARAA